MSMNIPTPHHKAQTSYETSHVKHPHKHKGKKITQLSHLEAHPASAAISSSIPKLPLKHKDLASHTAMQRLKSATISESARVLADFRADCDLLSKKSTAIGSSENQKEFNEDLFCCLKDLYEAKKLFKNKDFADEAIKLESLLHALNPRLPKIQDIVQVFGEESLKETLSETVTSLCKKNPVKEHDLERDCQLFSCDSIEMQAIYAQRMIKAVGTGYSLSLVAAIETTWQKMQSDQHAKTEKHTLDNLQVVFIPSEKNKGGGGEVYVYEKFLDKGGFKAAYLATPFFQAMQQKDRSTAVILQPIESQSQKKDEETEEIGTRVIPQEPEKADESEKTEVLDVTEARPDDNVEAELQAGSKKDTSPIETADSDDSSIEEEGVSVRYTTSYEKEAALCLEVGHVEGVWPTHKVTRIDGETVIIQKTAGYKMQLNDGSELTAINLRDMLKQSKLKKLQPKDHISILHIVENTLTGVHGLHQQGIIHRDLKPSNILCAEDGRGGVSDLGLACKERQAFYEGAEDSAPNPQKRHMCGTSYYIAPEIASWTKSEKWKDIDSRADIWSLGMVLWEVFSGDKIYKHPAIKTETDSAEDIVGRLLIEEMPRFQKQYNDDFPKPKNENSMLYLIWSCTRPNPSDRIDISTLKEKYQLWAAQAAAKIEKGEFRSIQEVFQAEMSR